MLQRQGIEEVRRRRFSREAEALARVQHPNVVRSRGVGEERGLLYIVLDYHPGGTLQDVIERGALTPAEVCDLGAQLAAGLQAAHAVGILHRDVKPDNVLLAGGRPLLTDFGLARDLGPEDEAQRLTRSGVFLGTPGFWAPEQVRAEPADPRTDVYGLGATLYAALARQAPLLRSSLHETLNATLNDLPPPLRELRSDVPPQLAAVIRRCLEKDPAKRWQSAEELQDALELALVPERRRVGPLVGGGVALLALAGGALAWRPSSPPPSSPTAASPSASASPSATIASLDSSWGPRAEALLRARDYEAARKVAEAGVAREDTFALRVLGRIHEKGLGVAKDGRRAEELYRRAARAGDLDGMSDLGLLLMSSRGGESAEWFRKASDAGSARAMNNLGMAYLGGKGVEKDYAQAKLWFERATAGGDMRGPHNLGLLYFEGLGVENDLARAVECMKLAVERGHTEAMIQLGQVKLRVPELRDPEGGLALIRRAADLREPKAVVALGHLYEEGRYVERDYAEALRCYERGVEQGVPQAARQLAKLYGNGRGVPRDYERARAYLEQAIAGGDRESYVVLASVYRGGLGVERDLERATALCRKGAEAGDASAMHNYATALEQGDGVEKDMIGAVLWYERSAKAGYGPAMVSLAQALAEGRGVERRDEQRAREWLEQAAALGVPHAKLLLGLMHERGMGGLTIDREAAAALYRQAAASSNPQVVERARAALEVLEQGSR